MAGGTEVALDRAGADLSDPAEPATGSGLAIDPGAGIGMRARVLAVDACEVLAQ